MENTNNAVSKIKSDALTGAIAGMLGAPLVGLFIGITLIFIGLLFTLTIIGAVIGIPLISAGIWIIIISPFAGLVGGLVMKRASCPVCAHTVRLSFLDKGVTCRACKTRLVMHNKSLIVVPQAT